MTRISILTRDDMNDEQRAVIDDSVASGQPHGGPFWAYVRHPKMMRLVQDTSSSLNESSLTPREHIIAMLTVARHWSAK